MEFRRFRLRFRRKIKRTTKQASEFSTATDDSVERYIIKRLARLLEVKRFLAGWIGLIVLISVASILQFKSLAQHHLVLTPSSGGIFREGIVGGFSNANPIYAQNEVDASVSKLVFSGLFKYDESGKLVPDLAEKYELDSSETSYTVTLKNDLKWHDGKPLTAKDVVFTYNTIQNSEVKSYLYSSWQGVNIKASGDMKVIFKLSNALSAFPHSLTNGIIPEHILSKISPSQLRSSKFNNLTPVGCGPFKFQSINLESDNNEVNSIIVLVPFKDYHEGLPKLERFIVRAYQNESSLVDAFNKKDIDSINGLKTLPGDFGANSSAAEYRISLSSEVMVFFKNTEPILNSKDIRKALVLGINKTEALQTLKYPVLPITEPLLSDHVGFDKALAQETNKKDEANQILETLGWKRDTKTGIRSKDGQPLKFRLFSSGSAEFSGLTSSLQKQWRELGVQVDVVLETSADLQTNVNNHEYDALLYGISVGSDPDVYAYWHSTQADIRSATRLNLSEYKSAVADKALEAGRTRSDTSNRAAKYKPFLQAWHDDYPALALYQQQFLYITSNNFSGLNSTLMHASTDRYTNVVNWTIKKSNQKITKT